MVKPSWATVAIGDDGGRGIGIEQLKELFICYSIMRKSQLMSQVGHYNNDVFVWTGLC